MTIPKTCARVGCASDGTHLPVIEMRWKPYGSSHDATWGLLVCADCTKHVTLDDLVDADAWAQLVAMLRALGKPEPQRELTTLAWRPPGSAEHAVLVR